jgi:CheY-like chemotaxis protein
MGVLIYMFRYDDHPRGGVMATILVVEDNRGNMELVTGLLEAAGHVVRPATTAEEGLTMAHAEQPDLILMDIRLPGLPGSMAVRVLKNDLRTEHIPAIALTAQAIKRDDESALEVGFDGYLSKPIDTGKFSAAVNRFLNLRRRV